VKVFYKEWIPFIGTLFFFVFGCNCWCSYTVEINRITSGELALTNDINTTVALALLTSFYFYAGLSKKGLGYFKRIYSATTSSTNYFRRFYETFITKFPIIWKHFS
jgi:F-type H+-transporting ATPase subunit a